MKRHEIEIVGGQIDWKNFTGVERTQIVNGRPQIVNAEGKRGFAAIIDPVNSQIYFDGELVTDPDFGQTLFEMGYKVNIRPGKEEGDPATYRLPVEIKFPEEPQNSRYVPRIYQVTPDGRKIPQDESTIRNFDEVDILKANFKITNSTSIDRNTGEERAKTWCNYGYFWVREDRLDPDYDRYMSVSNEE